MSDMPIFWWWHTTLVEELNPKGTVWYEGHGLKLDYFDRWAFMEQRWADREGVGING